MLRRDLTKAAGLTWLAGFLPSIRTANAADHATPKAGATVSHPRYSSPLDEAKARRLAAIQAKSDIIDAAVDDALRMIFLASDHGSSSIDNPVPRFTDHSVYIVDAGRAMMIQDGLLDEAYNRLGQMGFYVQQSEKPDGGRYTYTVTW